MKVVGRQIIDNFALRHADARSAIESWFAEAEEADWKTPQDIKAKHANASFLSRKIVVFNLRGNNYRLAVKIAYNNKTIIIINIGTHQEYNTWKL